MNLPHFVSSAISKIESAGFLAYVVGGCVRDSILGRTPTDWDIATSALPWDIENTFPSEHVIPTGIKHGTVTVIWEDVPLEITTFRVDGDYKDNRHPENVTFSASIEEDLSRRDFSVNAMAYSPIGGIIDPFGGQKDLTRGIIRAVGNPKIRFCEDALRIMRAVRFAAQLGFDIDESTFSAMQSCSALLQNISAERITSELAKTLAAKEPGDILSKSFEITAPLFFGQQSKTTPNPSFAFLDRVPCDIVLRLAAYLIISSKTLNASRLSLAETFFSRMKFKTQIKNSVFSILKHWDSPIPDDKIATKLKILETGFDAFENLLAIKSAFQCKDAARGKLFFDEIVSNKECLTLKSLDITGRDLSKFPLTGKQTGDALNFLLDAVIREKCPNKKDALLEYLKENFI